MPRPDFGRSAALAVMLLVGLCQAAGDARAASGRIATGIIEIDQPAITAKAPDRVFLDAIAVAGTRLVAVGEHGVIIFSDDNGTSWTQAKVSVSATLTAVAFTTPLLGWAAGNYGVVLRTEDGGRTWTTKLHGLQVPDLTMQAAKEATQSQSTAPGAAASMHRADKFAEQGPDKPFLAVLGLGERSAIAFGGFRMAFRTDDDGATWKDWSLHVDDPVSHHIYGAARIGQSLYLAGEAGLVFRSDDDGGQFKAVTSPSDATLFGIIPVGKAVLAYGVGGMVYQSGDNGASWHGLKIGDGGNLTAALTLQNGDVLIAEQSGRLSISHDQGASFTALGINLPMAVADVVQARDGSLLVVGNRGVMRVPLGAGGPS